jgi:Ca-activated chloride channel family protein
VVTAIGELRPNGATSLGSAILTSLDAIAGKRLPIDPQALQAGTPQKGLPFLGSAVVVLLSDGEDTSQLDPVAVADVAAQTGVRVDPIGLGTANGAVITVEGVSLATSLDATSLRQIAKQTNGTYYQADHAASLVNVYRNVSGHLQLTTSGEKTEITSVFAGAALLLVLVGAALSMRWFGRVL